MNKYYMHTIDSHPAFYNKNSNQICYGSFYGAVHHNILATSLKQIRKEQELTKNYRLGKGFDYYSTKYGYILVYTK